MRNVVFFSILYKTMGGGNIYVWGGRSHSNQHSCDSKCLLLSVLKHWSWEWEDNSSSQELTWQAERQCCWKGCTQPWHQHSQVSELWRIHSAGHSFFQLYRWLCFWSRLELSSRGYLCWSYHSQLSKPQLNHNST